MLSIGLMSGTSMDGIDAALIDTDGKFAIRELDATTLLYDSEFKLLLKAAEQAVHKQSGDLTAAQNYFPKAIQDYYQSLDIASHASAMSFVQVVEHSTRLHAMVVKQLLQQTRYKAEEIAVIGYHGQTLFHQPAAKLTIQIGNGALLAQLTKIKVVNDFRHQDVVAGGQGAPFAPIYHQALAMRDNKYPVAIVNCGGIANITVIIGNTENDVQGFDTGPGNCLIDRYVMRRTRGREMMDTDGRYGQRGQVHDDVLQRLYRQYARYFLLRPPRSFDVNDFDLIAELDQLSLEDGCATLAALTADTILQSTTYFSHAIPDLWILAGGGWKNPVLFNELKIRLRKKYSDKIKIYLADEIGWKSQSLEAQIFAYLAVRCLLGLPTSFPSVTGVTKPIVGGCINNP